MPIYLARHGETTFNATRVLQPPDSPLSDHGHEQARRLAARLAGMTVAAILCSDYARARMTAAAIEDATGAPVEVEPLLRERNFGDHRGTPYDELPVNVFAPGYQPPNGESWEAFHARAASAWGAITAFAGRVEGNVAVVSHALVCHSIVERQLGVPREVDGQVVRWRNTALTVIDGGPPWAVTRLACAMHLDAPPDPPGAGPALA